MNARPAELEKLSQGQADSRTVHRDSPGGETDLEQSKDTLTDKSAENPRTQTQKETRHQHPRLPSFPAPAAEGLGSWGALGGMLSPTPWGLSSLQTNRRAPVSPMAKLITQTQQGHGCKARIP